MSSKGAEASASACLRRPESDAANKSADLSQPMDKSIANGVKSLRNEQPALDISSSGNNSSSSFAEERSKGYKRSLSDQHVIWESLKAKEKALKPATHTPATVSEPQLTNKSAFTDAKATRIPREDILDLFPDEQSWRVVYSAAIESNTFAKKGLMAQILHLSCLKNSVIAEIIHRGDLLTKERWPFIALPDAIKQNQREWINWITSFDQVVAHGLKHITWTELLEQEYKTAEPMWKRFWDLHKKDEQEKANCEFTYKVMPPTLLLNELEEIYAKMAVHNHRRAFLQSKMMAGREWVAWLYMHPPGWIDWPEVVRNMFGTVDGRPESEEVDRGYESGHVSEPESEEEEEEDFEL